MTTSLRKRNVREATFIMEKTKKTLNNFRKTKGIKNEQNPNQSKNNKRQRVQVSPAKVNKPHKWPLNQSHISNNPYPYLNNRKKSFLHLLYKNLILT